MTSHDTTTELIAIDPHMDPLQVLSAEVVRLHKSDLSPAGQLWNDLVDASPGKRLLMLADLLDQQRRSEQCVLQNHEGRLHEQQTRIERLQDEPDTYCRRNDHGGVITRQERRIHELEAEVSQLRYTPGEAVALALRIRREP